MTFLALIISLALLQHWGSAGPLHQDDWFAELRRILAGSGLGADLQLLSAVVLPALLLFWLQSLIQGWLFGLVGLAMLVVVLLYSFGRKEFEGLVNRYRESIAQGDFEAAYLFAREELLASPDEECPSSPEQLHRWVKQRICYLGYERWFAVIFYFAVLGAPLALAYRLLHLYSEHCEEEQRQKVQKVLYFVDWVPARFLVFAFALTGDWVGSREQVMASVQDTETEAGGVIADAAHAALGLKATVFSSDNGDTTAFAEISAWEIGELQSLLSRSAVAWVVTLSLLVLFI